MKLYSLLFVFLISYWQTVFPLRACKHCVPDWYWSLLTLAAVCCVSSYPGGLARELTYGLDEPGKRCAINGLIQEQNPVLSEGDFVCVAVCSSRY